MRVQNKISLGMMALAMTASLLGASFSMPGTLFAAASGTSFVGPLQRFMLTDDSGTPIDPATADRWSAAQMVVNDTTIIIPRNMVIDLPANRLTAQEFFAQAPADCIAAGESGLAAEDTCLSKVVGFPSILANQVATGNVIAGEIMMEKDPVSAQGVISFIDYTDGYFIINQAGGSLGTMIRPNDPISRHTIQQGLGCVAGSQNCSPDPRYTNDPDNYTFTYSNGYPFCIPSTVSRSAPFALTPGGAVTN